METVVQPPVDDELHLLTDWGDLNPRSRTREAAIFSVVVHVALIIVLALLPAPAPRRLEAPEVHRIVTPLIEPLTELTQKAPNTSKVSKEFTAAEVVPRPRIQIPAA